MSRQRSGLLDISKYFGPRYDRIQVFYSTPEYYTKFKHESFLKQQQGSPSMQETTTTSWKTKTDDFFPYSSCENCFWTGYFTSRTSFKRLERVASSFLLAARQIDALFHSSNDRDGPCPGCGCRAPLYDLEDALGMAQHHDAVSGTAKQHVSDDYSKNLQHGLDRAARYIQRMLQDVLPMNESLNDLTYCQLLNETTCEVSERATKSNETSLYIVVYNPLARKHSTIVRLPVASPGEYRLEHLQGNQTHKIIRSVEASQHTCCRRKYVLKWDTGPTPALGAASFRVTKVDANDVGQAPLDAASVAQEQRRRLEQDDSEVVEVSNGLVAVQFERRTGMMKKVSANGVDLKMEQTWGYYTSFDSSLDRSFVPSSDPKQNSGAYIFRPSTPTQDIRRLSPRRATFVNTTVGTEVHISFEQPWIHQIIRILTGQPFVEVEYTIGPIPIDDGRGKEIVTRYSAPIASSATFYTDSNGREFLRRQRNHRPSWDLDVYEPVAGNYYPVNAATYLQDNTAAMAVVVDRSQGGSSLQDGVLELMVQRRNLADDAKGVDEPLNETCGGMSAYPPYGKAERLGEGVIVRGVHRLMVGKGPVGASLARSVMDTIFAEPLVFVGSAPSNEPVAFQKTTFSGLKNDLPENVMLVTFSRIADRGGEATYLLRLGHQYGVDEDKNLSSPVSVDIAKIFEGYKVESITEMTLVCAGTVVELGKAFKRVTFFRCICLL
jgi:alpha-mannosidase